MVLCFYALRMRDEVAWLVFGFCFVVTVELTVFRSVIPNQHGLRAYINLKCPFPYRLQAQNGKCRFV